MPINHSYYNSRSTITAGAKMFPWTRNGIPAIITKTTRLSLSCILFLTKLFLSKRSLVAEARGLIRVGAVGLAVGVPAVPVVGLHGLVLVHGLVVVLVLLVAVLLVSRLMVVYLLVLRLVLVGVFPVGTGRLAVGVSLVVVLVLGGGSLGDDRQDDQGAHGDEWADHDDPVEHDR